MFLARYNEVGNRLSTSQLVLMINGNIRNIERMIKYRRSTFFYLSSIITSSLIK